MNIFLGYFDRLSYLLSQGHLACDVAIVYPVAPYEAELNGNKAKDTAFGMGQCLMGAGINFEFIDNDSLARAVVENGRLVVKAAGASYQALVLADMEAVRWPTIEKAAAFAQAGGRVYNIGVLPAVSDRAGRDDAELAALVDKAFKPECRFEKIQDAQEAISKAFVQDVRGVDQVVRALHRKAGMRDVYMVMDAKPGSVVEFRAKGAVELWDPWTGETRPLRVTEETSTGTRVELPLENYEAQVVVFTPGKKHVNPPPADGRPEGQKMLAKEWTVAFVPTMNNMYGDFRLPVTDDNRTIGLEARRFAWTRETEALAKTAMLPATDDSKWAKQLHGYGPQFYVLGPVPDDVDAKALDAELSKLKSVDPAVPVSAGGRSFKWWAYDFSWRMGKEGDHGHQGYHGLKRTVTDDFICLGKQAGGLNETKYEADKEGKRYYLWTSATAGKAMSADIVVSRGAPADKSHTSAVITPAAVFVNGEPVSDMDKPVSLKAGANPVLVRYDQAGRGHFVMRRHNTSVAKDRMPLSMRWYDDPGVIPFDVTAGSQPAEWFRFVSAPGTKAIDVKACGKVQAWLNGEPMKEKRNGQFVAEKVSAAAPVVALRVVPDTGRSGGAAIPEPVVVETDGTGVLALGDWSQVGILNNYSGGTRYSTVFKLTKEEAKASVTVDLGSVVATAEISVNGDKVAVLVAPPWKADITKYLKEGENKLEVLVYNTLANHYQTVPSRYRGSPMSGLIGPVCLLSRDWKETEAVVPTIGNERGISEAANVRATGSSGSVKALDRKIGSTGNLLRKERVLKSVTGTRAHDGGGSEFKSLFNGTAGNGKGAGETINDGKTFVGMADGNTLDMVIDTALEPKGLSISSICTYAGHNDARASQDYAVYAATLSAPDQFVKLADVSYDVPGGGMSEVSIVKADSTLVADGVSKLRFVFKNGPEGFNVYREIAVFGPSSAGK
jgi:hypothetical protein